MFQLNAPGHWKKLWSKKIIKAYLDSMTATPQCNILCVLSYSEENPNHEFTVCQKFTILSKWIL